MQCTWWTSGMQSGLLVYFNIGRRQPFRNKTMLLQQVALSLAGGFCCHSQMLLLCLLKVYQTRLCLDERLPVPHLIELCHKTNVDRFPGGLE